VNVPLFCFTDNMFISFLGIEDLSKMYSIIAYKIIRTDNR